MTKNNRRAYKYPRATCVAIDVVYFLRQHLARHDELVPEHGVAELLAPFLFFLIFIYFYSSPTLPWWVNTTWRSTDRVRLVAPLSSVDRWVRSANRQCWPHHQSVKHNIFICYFFCFFGSSRPDDERVAASADADGVDVAVDHQDLVR